MSNFSAKAGELWGKTKKLCTKDGIKGLLTTDGRDPRQNDPWRILLFALNKSGGLSIMQLIGKWQMFTQNVLELGVFLTSAVLVMKILDAITDPLIAKWFDTYQHKKYGKYRPFMLVGALLSFAPAIVIFCYPKDANVPLWVTYTVLLSMYAIIVVGNTILMTATRAGQAVITQDPKQRPIYALGQTVGDAAIMAFVSLMITGGLIGDAYDPFVWQVSVLVLSGVSIILVLIAIKAIENRDNPKYYAISEREEKPSFKDFFSVIRRNSAMKRLLWATITDSFAASMRVAMVFYLFSNILMKSTLNASFDIIQGVVLGAPAIMFGVWWATRKGLTKVYTQVSIVQTVLSILGLFACLIFAPLDSTATYTGFTFNTFIVLGVFALYMSSLSISSNLVTSMTGDLVDYEYYLNGKFIPGTIGAALTFVQKVATSGVSLVTMGIMLFCFEDGSDAVVTQNVYISDRFYYCILFSVFVMPCLGHLATYIAMKKYPITEEKMEEISEMMTEVRAKREAEKEAKILAAIGQTTATVDAAEASVADTSSDDDV
ncbi:MAG: MFS transporter [Bacillota bacterium]